MKMMQLGLFLGVALVACPSSSSGPNPNPGPTDPGPAAVYVMTNEKAGNRVMVYRRAANGTLTPGASFATGGNGSGTFEDSAGGLVLGERSPVHLGESASFLYATNANSNSISVFRVTEGGLELVGATPSGGQHPVSVTVRNNLLYVLNNGDAPDSPAFNCTMGTPNITGFRVGAGGELTPIAGSTRPVTGGSMSGCAQVSFSPKGNVLVVTERLANETGVIATYTVNADGTTAGPKANKPTGVGPFGFTFTRAGQLLISEQFMAAPGKGSAAPYSLSDDGTLAPLGPTVGNGGTDACWVVVTDDGKYAYVTNFFSGSVSSYRVAPDGSLSLLNAVADLKIGIGASDEALSADNRHLYALNSFKGTLTVYTVGSDGGLSHRQELEGLPRYSIGLAAR